MNRVVIASETTKPNNFQTGLNSEQDMDTGDNMNNAITKELVADAKNTYSDIPVELLRCTICDMTMTDGPVRESFI